MEHPQTDSSVAASEESSPNWLKELKDWAKTLLVSFVIVLLVHQFIFNISIVKGDSMEPTLSNTERLFINKIVYHLSDPKLGDIVILKDPRPGLEKQHLVKRVVGLPGDTVEIRQNKLYVNGMLSVGAFSDDAPVVNGEFGPLKIPDAHYFVLGDNRGRSTDSRDFGIVKENTIKGRADFRIWPLSKLGGL